MMGKKILLIGGGALLLLCLVAVGGRHFLRPDSASVPAGPSFIDRFDQHLVVLGKDGTLVPFDGSGLKNVRYFAVYMSASWCAPCRIFTPKLVDFYKSFKPQHPDFELIFVNHDAAAQDMLGYMKADGMPWPAVQFDAIDGTGLDNLDPNGYLPDLILVDAHGQVLSDTYHGDDSVGPDKVLDDIQHMVP